MTISASVLITAPRHWRCFDDHRTASKDHRARARRRKIRASPCARCYVREGVARLQDQGRGRGRWWSGSGGRALTDRPRGGEHHADSDRDRVPGLARWLSAWRVVRARSRPTLSDQIDAYLELTSPAEMTGLPG